MSAFTVQLEISGPTAIWTRPDSGDTPVSYPVPTYGAAKGIFECVLLSHWAEIIPTKVEICRPIIYHSYHTNYRGPLRKSRIMPDGAYQLMATVLVDVCYRLYAEPQSKREHYDKRGKVEVERQKEGTTNGAHAYQDRFETRLKQGRLHSTPFLGWKEFMPDYIGVFRPETTVCEDIDLVIPTMLRACFPHGRNSEWEPEFVRDVKIEKGVLEYAQ